MNEILLRGCTLKNSGFIVGLVVYTGPESRIQMNAAGPPRKQGVQHGTRQTGSQESKPNEHVFETCVEMGHGRNVLQASSTWLQWLCLFTFELLVDVA